jgi:hypothetical protein
VLAVLFYTDIGDFVKKVFVVLTFALIGTSCGYDGHYRYECQDPENWDAAECNPPMCKVDGACSKDLIGFDPFEIEDTVMENTPTEETVAP